MKIPIALMLATMAAFSSFAACSDDDEAGDDGPTQPEGAVEQCFGECPLGECDDDFFFADVSCTTVYPEPVTSESSYCSATDGSYCLMVEGDYWAIRCHAGEASFDRCTDGCGWGDGGAAC